MLHRLSLLLLLLCSAIVAPDTLTVYNMKALGFQRGPSGNGNGYVKVYHNKRHIGTTEVKKNTSNPVWEESFSSGNASSGNKLKLRVYDQDVWVDNWVGVCLTIIKMGDHQHTCNLFKEGLLKYRYSLQ